MKIIRQYSLFLIGLFIASMGVAFSTKAGLGTSPVASLPYSVSLVSSLLSFGGWLNVLSVIQIAVQVILLRKKCKPASRLCDTRFRHLAAAQGQSRYAPGRSDEPRYRRGDG